MSRIEIGRNFTRAFLTKTFCSTSANIRVISTKIHVTGTYKKSPQNISLKKNQISNQVLLEKNQLDIKAGRTNFALH
jgi:hypothetical protein